MNFLKFFYNKSKIKIYTFNIKLNISMRFKIINNKKQKKINKNNFQIKNNSLLKN